MENILNGLNLSFDKLVHEPSQQLLLPTEYQRDLYGCIESGFQPLSVLNWTTRRQARVAHRAMSFQSLVTPSTRILGCLRRNALTSVALKAISKRKLAEHLRRP